MARRRHATSPRVPTRADPPRAPSPAQGPRPWLLLAPMALAVLAYARALGGEFQFDDFHAIVDNAGVKDLAAAATGSLRGLLQGGRPVAALTFALDYAAGHLDPWRYHVTNLALHLVTVALVLAFTRAVLRLAGAARPAGVALFVAGAFALHPLQTQAVSYVVQRAEVLASAFYLGALLLLLQAERRGPTAAGGAAWLGATAAFALGLGTKPIAATAPLAWLLLGAVVPGPTERAALRPPWARLGMVLPWLALGGAFAWASLHAVAGTRHAGLDLPQVGPGTYLRTQALVVPTYLRLILWPAGQNVDWAFPFAREIDGEVLAGAALVLALVAGSLALVARARRWEAANAAAARVAAFGVLWFFLVLAPSSSVVPLADALVEHRLYLALWGILAALGAAGERLGSAAGVRWSAAAPAAAAAVWLVLAGLTWHRNGAWESRLSLWSDAAAKAPRNWRAHLQLGDAHADRGEPERAIEEYQRALDGGARAAPEDEGYVLRSLGLALKRIGRREAAARALQRSLDLAPGDPDATFTLANLRREVGDAAGAEAMARRAVELQPAHGPALALLGCILAERGDAAGALPLLQRAVATDPDQSATQLYVAQAYTTLDRRAEACAAWQRALRVELAPAVREMAERMVAATCR
ncbi:MAG TPA: tetratricopeptide repeat protein [Anaeromyxobacteraceae bacterium]|nr:tetratricopeptide repeat protein [Anaeromyxobacteraceae bacterium]